MSYFVWVLSVGGLAVSILGSIALFFGTPFDTGGIQLFSFGDDQADIKQKKMDRKALLSKVGFMLLLIGFVIQLIALILQKP